MKKDVLETFEKLDRFEWPDVQLKGVQMRDLTITSRPEGKQFYVGCWHHSLNKPHGLGIQIDINGNLYEGEFKDGLFHGQGR